MPYSAELQAPADNRWQHAKISLIAPVLLWLTLICAVEITVRQEQLRARSTELQRLGDSANEIRSLFQYQLNATLHLATGVEAYIQSKNGELVSEELAPWLSHLQEHSPHIRDIALAPGNRVAFVYPIAGNEKVIGFYYPDSPTQWPMVEKAMQTRQPILAGPLELKQGGKGLLYRVPIYLSKDNYWGVISTVLNFDDMYAEMIQRAGEMGIRIAVLDTDDNSQLVFGDRNTNRDYELPLGVPGRHWTLIAAQTAPQDHSFVQARVIGWMVSFAATLLLYSLLRTLARQHGTTLALAESQYRFSQAFNSAPQGIALINHTGELLDFNTSLCSTLGYRRLELLDTNFYDLMAPAQREQLRQMMTGSYPWAVADQQYESKLLHRDGKPRNVIISIAPTQRKSDHRNWIVQIIDISHRVAFEQLLREEAQYNQAIFNAVAEGIMIVDLHGVIRAANPACGHIFGGTSVSLHRLSITQFVKNPAQGDLVQYFKQQVDDHKASPHHEIAGIKFTGEEFPLELQLSSINRNGETLLIVVMRDISERKRLERMKNEFISTISHELRTPLTSVLGSLRVLASGKLNQQAAQTQKLIEIANQNGDKLARLIDDLLDMDKSLAGKMQLDVKVQEIIPLVTQAIELNTAYANQYKVKFVLQAVDTPLFAAIDSHRLQQVLANLMSNAAKFSPANSIVRVAVTQQSGVARISVTDNGIGIPAHLQSQLFQKFFQVDSSNTRQKGGTGLGLAIAKQLVEAMQGTIGVESEEGRGSCFYIDIPLVQQVVAEHG